MKLRMTLGLIASGAIYVSPADAADGPDLEIYGTLLPFLEYVGTSGATAPTETSQATQLAGYSGTEDPYRFRMTSGTSNLGFRGALPVTDNLKLIFQVENAVPVDGNGPNTWASRNTHVGFAGNWGTLIYGIWDTPFKIATSITINPLVGGYISDYTAIINSPGHGGTAFNAGPAGNAGFFRRESNAVQYWTPDLAGFSARVMFAANENRTSGSAAAMPPTSPANPYALSGYLGYDGHGLRVRYAFELHNDYYGMAVLGGSPAQSLTASTSTDTGHQLTAAYAINAESDFRTRIAATGDLLSYKTDDTTMGAVDEFSRPSFYGLIEQSFYAHHVFAGYGMAMEGSCGLVGAGDCTTTGLGAQMATLGYLYAINPRTNIHVIGYGVFNDVSARYSPFPPISPIAAGADLLGVGVGFIHAFNVGIINPPPPPAPPKP